MNVLPTYELIIAERLEGIDVPDTADAIWGRIEAALDIEMPVQTVPPVLTNPAVWAIGAGIVAFIIALFILSKTHKTAPPVPPPPQSKSALKTDTALKEPVKPPDIRKPLPQKVFQPKKREPSIPQKIDTVMHASPVVPARQVITIPPPALELKPKKQYGVELSDSDYRFKMKPKQ